MKFSLEFYKDKILNQKSLEINDIEKIVKQYTPDNCPKDYVLLKRTNNFFEHDIHSIKEEYKKLQPYFNDKNELVKSSNKEDNPEKKLGKNTIIWEKDFCKELWFWSYDGVEFPFDIIDIQVPLKKQGRNNNYGELDNLGIDVKGDTIYLYLIEVKPPTTEETLLRASIEIITYSYLINANKEKFIDDFEKYILKYKGKGKKALAAKKKIQEGNKKIEIKPLVLVPKKLYTHRYFKIKKNINYIYSYYKDKVEYYSYELDSTAIIYHSKDERTTTLFREGYSPIIEKLVMK